MDNSDSVEGAHSQEVRDKYLESNHIRHGVRGFRVKRGTI